MRVSTKPVVLLTLILGACGSDAAAPNPAGLSAASAANRSQSPSRVSRPFAGACELTFSPPPFPLPPVFTSTDTGTCNFTELGKTEFYGVQQINFLAGTQSGQRAFTAANGDVLRLEHVGTSAPIGPGLVSFRATATVVGGTGRFEHATGQLIATGVANLATRTSIATFEGMIAYDASDRSRP
jgi:hypothetical protein